jgi:dihydropteroate synthase
VGYQQIQFKGKLFDFFPPVVMGILNITPDSFFEGSRVNASDLCRRASDMLSGGATILDIGGQSTRPGAQLISAEDEWRRVSWAINLLVREFPETIFSIDTFFSKVASRAIESGVAFVNDVSAGSKDPDMFATVATLGVPYVLTFNAGRGEAASIVVAAIKFLSQKIRDLRALGVTDILVDPGFGFGKTLDENYQLLGNLNALEVLETPILAGLSRKSMIYKHLNIEAKAALNGTSALHMVALQQGSHILRVHDVKEAVEVISLFEILKMNTL